jgi:hypothetical protein
VAAYKQKDVLLQRPFFKKSASLVNSVRRSGDEKEFGEFMTSWYIRANVKIEQAPAAVLL